MENDSGDSCELPIYGVYYAGGDSVPFADLYLDI